MAKFTIDLPERLLAGLQTVVTRHNADNGTTFTVESWLNRHVAEVAVQDELLIEQAKLAKHAQDDLEAALRAVRERLVSGEEIGSGK
jgi:hypothetical protein